MINGNQVLKRFSLENENYWFNIGIIFIIFIGYRLLAFLALHLSVKTSRYASTSMSSFSTDRNQENIENVHDTLH